MRNRFAVLGSFVTGAVVLVSYALALRIGFVWDDYGFINELLTKSFRDYLVFYFDPRVQIIWYRPIYGMLWWVEFLFFKSEPAGYHLVWILLHLSNCLLLFKLTARGTRNARVALVATSIYAGLLVYAEGVLWPADAQPEASLYYLLALWFWWSYLERVRARDYAIAFAFATLAVFTKETSVTLPIIFFLFDRLVIKKPASPAALARRYIPLALLILLYGAFVYRALTYGIFPNVAGYRPGGHWLPNFSAYLTKAFYPWVFLEPLRYAAFAGAAIVAAWRALKQSKTEALFLWFAAVVFFLPALPLPVVKERYLYMSMMATAILFALAIEALFRQRVFALRALAGLGLALIVLNNGFSLAEASLDRAELSRTERVIFRTIAQRHPQFPAGTHLYFMNGWAIYWGPMFKMRYGATVSITDIYDPRVVGLRQYANPIVIHLNERGDPLELAVDQSSAVNASPALPVEFEQGIRLEGYELTKSRLKRGEPFALILYWKATRPLTKDYTVFLHLLDENGNIIEGQDSQPREGKSPTSGWSPGDLIPDGRLLFVPNDAPTGKRLYLAIGLYDLLTAERLAVLDGSGKPILDAVVIEPIEVVE